MNNGERIKKLFPRGSRSFFNANAGLQPEANKPTSRKALGAKMERKTKSDDRIGLRYVLYRVRLLDPDATHNATKVITDCLCEVGILPGDSNDDITLQVTQEKVNHRSEEKTVVHFDRLP